MKNSTLITYSNCYVAFLDILGFKNRIVTSSCAEIYSIFKLLDITSHADLKINGTPVPALDKVQHKVMSDSIVLYIDAKIPDALFSLMFTCQHLQTALLYQKNPILIRGGIAKGNLFSENDILFGKGLTDAYQLQKNIAIYPRIIFTKQLLEDGRYNYEMCNSGLDTLITYPDRDGLVGLHFMSIGLLKDMDEATEYIDNVLQFCEQQLDFCLEARIREKILWLREKTIWFVNNSKDLLVASDVGKQTMEKWKL